MITLRRLFQRARFAVAGAAIALTGACLPGTASAEPSFLLTSNASDLTSDGNSVVGVILDQNVNGLLHIFTRGSGHQVYGDPFLSNSGSLLVSDDRQYIATALYNGFFVPQDPPFGNYTPTAGCCVGSACSVITPAACAAAGGVVLNGGCSPSPCPLTITPTSVGACCTPIGVCTVTTQAACASPNYWFGNFDTCGSNPCRHGHFVSHRMTTASELWDNIGSFPNTAGQGASFCDANVNQPYDMSANGQFITGSGQYGPYGTTSCNTRGFVWNAADNVVRQLPLTGTGCQAFSQGNYVSSDGLRAAGTDTRDGPSDPNGVTAPVMSLCNARCLVVWERSSATADFTLGDMVTLDRFGGGGLGNMVMNSQGTIVAAALSEDAALYDEGDAAKGGGLVRYTKVSNVWTRQFIGRVPGWFAAHRPITISNDGNTIVGVSGGFFDFEGYFIWRPTVNGGSPMELGAFLRSINNTVDFANITPLDALSADGNALLARVTLPDTICPPGSFGLQPLPQSGILYFNSTGIACEPPRVLGGPYSKAQEEYTQFGIVGNVFASGTHPMTWQWQKESPSGSGNWLNVDDSCGGFSTDPVNPWSYEGTRGPQLRINMLAPAASRDGNYRVVISNSCGNATSQVAAIGAVTGACCYIDRNSGQPVCSVEMENRCTGSTAISFFFGGVYLGNNTVCSPTTCADVSGACCFASPGSTTTNCVIDIKPNCELALNEGGRGGTFTSSGSTCTPAACNSVSGACCYSPNANTGTICTFIVRSACDQSQASGYLGGTYRGNASTCTPTACNAIIGACCYAPTFLDNVICTLQTQARCQGELREGGLQGQFLGIGEVCVPSDLCNDVAGACCYTPVGTDTPVCTIQRQLVCTTAINGRFFDVGGVSTLIMGMGGVYKGDLTTCAPNTCTSSVGACCYSPSFGDCRVCTITPQTRCVDFTYLGGLEGSWGGPATSCTPTPQCDLQLGACCVDSFCNVTCQSICDSNLGEFRGSGSSCEPDPCSPAVAVCCRGSTCTVNLQNECTDPNGAAGVLYLANAALCNNGVLNAPCCYADYNKASNVSVQDIFDFLSDWFAGSPFANVGGDGSSGSPNVQDIFDFLAAWFAGC